MESKSSSLLASPSRRSSCHVPGSPKRHPGAHAKFSPQVHDSASERQEPKDAKVEEQVSLRPGAVHVDTVRGAGKFAVRKGASRGRGLHLDIDFDGDLSGGTVQEKLRAALATNWGKVSVLFQTWDSDGTGVVSHQEFAEAMAALGLCASPAAIDGIFCSFDLDGSGEVDAQEMHKILRQTPPKPTLLTRNKWQRTLQPPPPLPLPATAATAAAAAAATATTATAAGLHSRPLSIAVGDGLGSGEPLLPVPPPPSPSPSPSPSPPHRSHSLPSLRPPLLAPLLLLAGERRGSLPDRPLPGARVGSPPRTLLSYSSTHDAPLHRGNPQTPPRTRQTQPRHRAQRLHDDKQWFERTVLQRAPPSGESCESCGWSPPFSLSSSLSPPLRPFSASLSPALSPRNRPGCGQASPAELQLHVPRLQLPSSCSAPLLALEPTGPAAASGGTQLYMPEGVTGMKGSIEGRQEAAAATRHGGVRSSHPLRSPPPHAHMHARRSVVF